MVGRSFHGPATAIEPYPTIVKGRCWDVLAANPAARELFGDWSGGSGGRNLVRWMFTSDAARDIYLEWEPEARAMLGRFRLAAARHPGDRRVSTSSMCAMACVPCSW